MQLQEIFLQIVNMSLMATVIIVAILGIRLLLKRAPKAFAYVLWGVVLFRLLCPVSFATELSVFRLFDMNTANSGRVEMLTEQFVYVGDIVADSRTDVTDKQMSGDLSETALMQDGYVRTQLSVADVAKDEQISTLPSTSKASLDSKGIVMAALVGIWLAGMILIALYSVIQMWVLRRSLIGSVPYKENIYYADHISTPFVLGVIRPRIYVPSALDKSEWDYIIMHERHHIRRGDHIVRILAYLALCIHWFNPLVWVAFVQSGKDMEMSCDEAVMRQMKQDIRAEYSQSLLRLATGRSYMTAMPLSFGEGNTKGRVKNVMRYRKPSVWIMVVAVVLCAVVVIGCASNPPKQEMQDESQAKVAQIQEQQEENTEEAASAEAIYLLSDAEFEPSDLISTENVKEHGIMLEPLTSSGAGEKGFAIEVFELDELWMMEERSYYYPSQEVQLEMWELLRGIGWTVDDETQPWLSMKETGWKIHCNQQTFMVFEGGYIYWEKAEDTETKRYFGQCMELCDMIQEELTLNVRYESLEPAQIKGIKSIKVIGGKDYGFAQNVMKNPETLALFERWFQEAEYIWGGVDCEMTNLCITLEDVQYYIALATDGSPVFALNGVFYNFCPMEYRESGDWDMEDFKMYFEPIPDVVQEEVNEYVQQQFEGYGEGYFDWRIEDLRYQYTYDDFNGMKLHIYRFNYEFLAINPDEVELVGGMEMDEEGWVVPGYPNSHLLIFEEKDGKLEFLTYFGRNDCYPGDITYTSDLQYWWENRINE